MVHSASQRKKAFISLKKKTEQCFDSTLYRTIYRCIVMHQRQCIDTSTHCIVATLASVLLVEDLSRHPNFIHYVVSPKQNIGAINIPCVFHFFMWVNSCGLHINTQTQTVHLSCKCFGGRWRTTNSHAPKTTVGVRGRQLAYPEDGTEAPSLLSL